VVLDFVSMLCFIYDFFYRYPFELILVTMDFSLYELLCAHLDHKKMDTRIKGI